MVRFANDRTKWLRCTLAVSYLVFLWGCSPSAPAPDAITIQEAPKALNDALAKIQGEAKQEAQGVLEALKAGKSSDSYLLLDQLSRRPDLSSSERDTVSRVRLGVMVDLQQKAANGDAQAAAFLQHQQANR